MAIRNFRGENFFLSNMYPVEGGIEIADGIVTPTSENIYQATKFQDIIAKIAVIGAETGFQSKRIASKLEKSYPEMLAPDWQSRKIEIMRACIAVKFGKNEKLAELLANTGDEELIEGNSWGDNFWGTSPADSDNGENYLGHIIMDARKRIVVGGELQPARLLEPDEHNVTPESVLKETLIKGHERYWQRYRNGDI